MRIHRVEVKNFRRFAEPFVLNLCDEAGKPRPLTVLVGPNMSGKTTILDAIQVAFNVSQGSVMVSWRSGFDPDDAAIRPAPGQPLETSLTWSLHENEWQAAYSVMDAGAFPVEATLYQARFPWPDDFRVNGAPENASRGLRGRHAARRAISDRRVSESILDTIGGLLYLDQGRTRHFTADGEVIEGLARPSVGIRSVVSWLAQQSLLHMKWNEKERGESRWSRVRRLFAKLASPATIVDAVPFDDGYDLQLRNGDREYWVGGMSSGERQILQLCATLAHFRAQRSFIMIDELELDLHPRWQRSLLHFCETGGDDDNQFLITTHSETVLRYAHPQSIVTLDPVPGEW